MCVQMIGSGRPSLVSMYAISSIAMTPRMPGVFSPYQSFDWVLVTVMDDIYQDIFGLTVVTLLVGAVFFLLMLVPPLVHGLRIDRDQKLLVRSRAVNGTLPCCFPTGDTNCCDAASTAKSPRQIAGWLPWVFFGVAMELVVW